MRLNAGLTKRPQEDGKGENLIPFKRKVVYFQVGKFKCTNIKRCTYVTLGLFTIINLFAFIILRLF